MRHKRTPVNCPQLCTQMRLKLSPQLPVFWLSSRRACRRVVESIPYASMMIRQACNRNHTESDGSSDVHMHSSKIIATHAQHTYSNTKLPLYTDSIQADRQCAIPSSIRVWMWIEYCTVLPRAHFISYRCCEAITPHACMGLCSIPIIRPGERDCRRVNRSVCVRCTCARTSYHFLFWRRCYPLSVSLSRGRI